VQVISRHGFSITRHGFSEHLLNYPGGILVTPPNGDPMIPQPPFYVDFLSHIDSCLIFAIIQQAKE
ncbi:hypothetical protein ACHAQD_009233, partial [Fusarium lateritium]